MGRIFAAWAISMSEGTLIGTGDGGTGDGRERGATYRCATGVARPKSPAVFRTTTSPRDSLSMPLAAATFDSVCVTYAGWFRFPRYGTGARYGASDSTRIRSKGIDLIRSSSVQRLKVTTPLNETYHPAFNAASASVVGPVKQWRTPRTPD